MAKKRKKTHREEIRAEYRSLEEELEQDAEEFFDGYVEEYEEVKEQDEKQIKAWALAILLTPHWKRFRHRMALKLTNADVMAAQITNEAVLLGARKAFGAALTGISKEITAKTIQSRLKGVFDLFNKDSVKYLKASKVIFPERKIPEKSATAWHEKQINKAIQSGIVRGKAIPDIASEIKTACRMSEKSSLRATQTAMTGAHGAGTQMAFEAAQEQGVELEKEWMATYDDLTRDSHAHLDGERAPIDEEFSNGCMFPGDPNGPPEEVWNCRCNMRAIVKGINEKERYGKSAYGRY